MNIGGGIMIKIYQTDINTNRLITSKVILKNSWIDIVNPTDTEIGELAEKLKIDTDFIKYVLDDEEQPRIDMSDEWKLILVDIPYKEKKHKSFLINTTPLAILIVRDEYIITISKENEILKEFKNDQIKEFVTNKKSRFTIQMIYHIATRYLKYLRTISKQMDIQEEKMYHSMTNKDLEKMLSLEMSLVYMTTSLKSNKLVLDKIMKGNVIPFYDEDMELLEDAVIENNQAIEMASLYREILSSITDSFANIISNNLNTLMKFLAGITIVISVPTMVSSFMGMNVPMGSFAENPYSFVIILGISVILSLIVAFILKKKNML